MKWELPEGWIEAKLGDIYAEVTERIEPGGEKLPYIGLEHIRQGGGILEIGSSENLQSLKTVFKSGDVLYGKLRPYLNKHVQVDFDGVCSTDILVFREIFNGQAAFLNYFLGLEEVIEFATANSQGSNLPRISREKILSLLIPLPPLPEQRRIVAKLDAAMGRLRAVEAALERVPGMLEQLRQSVLHWAVTGRLTEQWREVNKVENFDAIIEKIRQRRNQVDPIEGETEFDGLPILPSTWGYVSIGELEKFIGSGITPSGGSKNYLEKGIPFIRSQNVYPDGLFLDDIAYISPQIHAEMKRSQIKDKDVLLNITGASIGRCTYVPEGFGEANVNQHVCIIRLEQEVLPEFLTLYLNSPVGQKMIDDLQQGGTRQGLNYNQIRTFSIPLLALNEQIEIIKKAETYLKIIKAIESILEVANQKLSHTRYTLLFNAFRGELVDQDPKDEPALVLLERIREEKARLQETQKTERKKRQTGNRKATNMETTTKEIETILAEKKNDPIKAADVWRQSKYKDDIDMFYKKLRELVEKDGKVVQEVGSDQETYLSLKTS